MGPNITTNQSNFILVALNHRDSFVVFRFPNHVHDNLLYPEWRPASAYHDSRLVICRHYAGFGKLQSAIEFGWFKWHRVRLAVSAVLPSAPLPSIHVHSGPPIGNSLTAKAGHASGDILFISVQLPSLYDQKVVEEL